MKRHLRLLAAGAVLAALGQTAWAAPIDIAIDIDSTKVSGTDLSGPIVTQSGFTSWDLSNFASGGAGSTIVEDGITFQIFGTGNSATRVRPAGAGGEFEAITTDFLFNEGNGGQAVGLRISGLDVGLYGLQSWHFDSTGSVLNNPNAVQIELRNQGDPSGAPIVDNFLFGASPATFQMSVTEVGQVKEIIFREDSEFNRARLNGFTIRTIPEPTSLGIALLAAAAISLRRRST
jgi:hypothetical protein